MTKFLNFITHINTNILTITLIMIFFILERFIYTPFRFKKRGIHSFTNFGLFILSICFFYLIANFYVWTIVRIDSYHFGLLYHIDIPYYIKLIIGLIAFDFIGYWNHRISHLVPLFWRLHRVHHSDLTMDSTTGFRLHPFDLVWILLKLIGIYILGLDMNMVALFSLVDTIFVIFAHWNYVTPNWVDKTLGKIFTTPNLHKIHHSEDQYYTDSNFADILIIWDRIFGTYKFTDVTKLKYGLKEFESPKQQSLWHLLKSPFLNLKSK